MFCNYRFYFFLAFVSNPSNSRLQKMIFLIALIITLLLKSNSISLFRNPYRPQAIDKSKREGIYETWSSVKESIKIPNDIAAIEALHGPFSRETGNSQITGQQGIIPFIFSKSGVAITSNGKQAAVK